MRLLAISDLHAGIDFNFRALADLSPAPEDWLMLAGDVAEQAEDLRRVLQIFCPRFKQIVWVPGNHELWTMSSDPQALRGHEKYLEMVKVCREFGVLTPEDPYNIFESTAGKFCIVPMFLLYDYSFRPKEISADRALEWAADEGIVCSDEIVLKCEPYESLPAWCHARCELTYARLKEIPRDLKIIMLNHYPLRYDLVRLPAIPRFSLWCGTDRTENWHREFNVEAVVYGHLHMPSRLIRDGVRFEEVSLGYPRQWNFEPSINSRVRTILA